MAPKDLEERLEELEKFKTKVEIGSWWLKCLALAIGSLIVGVGGIITIIKDWPFKGH